MEKVTLNVYLSTLSYGLTKLFRCTLATFMSDSDTRRRQLPRPLRSKKSTNYCFIQQKCNTLSYMMIF